MSLFVLNHFFPLGPALLLLCMSSLLSVWRPGALGRQAVQPALLGIRVDKAVSFQQSFADHLLADASPTEAFHAIDHALVTAGLQ